MKKLITVLLILLLTSTGVSQAAPEVSATVGDLYYRLGGGKALPPPGAGFTTFNLRSRFTAGTGYSCGQFNFHENIEQIINQWMDRVRAIPSQLQSAVSSAIAGLPGYLMMKYNPTLYNIMTKTLDESAELFRLSYKSCRQIESEMARDPEANPYQGFLQASVMDKWTIGAENGEVAADVDEEIKADPADPIRWLGGHEYGSLENPLQINRDLVVAGYNIMIGRTGDVSLSAPPIGPSALEPIVQIWRSPADAGRWVQEVIGDKRVVLQGPDVAPETIPGKGLRPKVEALEIAIGEALVEAYDHNDYSLLNHYPSTLRISGALIDGLRSLPQGEAAVMMDRLVSEMAVKEAQERMFLIRQMIDTGLKAPDVIASTGGATADQYIRETTYPAIRTLLQEIRDNLELKQRTLNRTTVTILDRARRLRASGQQATPGVTRGDSNTLNH